MLKRIYDDLVTIFSDLGMLDVRVEFKNDVVFVNNFQIKKLFCECQEYLVLRIPVYSDNETFFEERFFLYLHQELL